MCFVQFPPYATNEIGRPGAALARREIGHGKYFYWQCHVLINIVNSCKFIYIKVKMILLKTGSLFGFDI